MITLKDLNVTTDGDGKQHVRFS